VRVRLSRQKGEVDSQTVLSPVGSLALYRAVRRLEDATWAVLAAPSDLTAAAELHDATSRLYGQIDALSNDLGGWSRKLRRAQEQHAEAADLLDQMRARAQAATSRPAARSKRRAT
jgi:hypothetical protein